VRWISHLLIVGACVGIALLLGKDVSWDQRHFHFYLGFSALHDRLAQDFYPASTQSYVVPYAFIPFYLLASSSLTDHAVVAVLAAFGAAALCIVWHIGGRLCGEVSGRYFDTSGAWLSVLLAAASPIFLSQLGNSFIDLPTAIPVLLAIAITLPLRQATPRESDLRAVFAGALLGMACALKLSNVVSAVGAFVIFVLLVRGWQSRARATGILVVAGTVSAFAVAGNWWWRVFSEFGNPTLPMFNDYFKSDAAEQSGSAMVRFVPVDLTDALLRPLWMLSPEKAVYIDIPAPDARFLFVNLLLAVVAAITVFMAATGRLDLVRSEIRERPLLWSLSAGLLITWPLWLVSSGNGRYYSPWFLLAGPLSIALLWRVVKQRRFRVYAVSALCAVQGYVIATGSVLRYHPVEWNTSGSWYEVKVPHALAQSPAVYFSMGLESASLVFPSLHPGSSFISAGGQYALATHMSAWRHVEARLNRDANSPIYLLVNVETYSSLDGSYNRPDRSTVTAMVSGLAMRAKAGACEDIWVQGIGTTLALASSATAGAPPRLLDRRMLIVACPIERADGRDPLIEKARGEASGLMDAVAQRCPLLFPAPAPFTFYNGHFWTRQYTGSDTNLMVDHAEIAYFRPNFYQPYRVGTPEQVKAGTFEVLCDLRREPIPIKKTR
jgi:hypothetical protein